MIGVNLYLNQQKSKNMVDKIRLLIADMEKEKNQIGYYPSGDYEVITYVARWPEESLLIDFTVHDDGGFVINELLYSVDDLDLQVDLTNNEVITNWINPIRQTDKWLER